MYKKMWPISYRRCSRSLIFFVQVDFLRGGEVVLTGDVIVGTVSVATGISKKGGFSLSIDERSLGGSIFNNGIHALLNKSKCPGLFAREVKIVEKIADRPYYKQNFRVSN